MSTEPAALFIGRFQPFHRGHLLVVQGMAKICPRVVIVIGSSNQSNTKENPFNAAERKDMMQRALQGVDLIPVKDISFVEVPDMAEDDAWTKAVLAAAGSTSIVWTGNEQVKALFEKEGIEVKWIKEVPGINATEIRQRMKDTGDWKSLVPPEVAGYLSEFDGPDRVRATFK